MRQREARWIDEVRPVPGGWLGKALLVALFVALVVSDVLNADVILTDPQGWVELILPYIPLLALLAGVVSGAVAWIVMFVVFLSMGIPTELLSASMIPMLITVGLATYALPRVPAGVFSGLVLILVLFSGLINPEIGQGFIFLGISTVCAIGAGLAANVMYGRSLKYAEEVSDLKEAQARIRNSERKRLAHELHDIVAHDVTVIAMQARRAEFVADDPVKTAQILEGIGDSASQALQDLRSLVMLLKTQTDDQSDADATNTESDDPKLSGETTTSVGLVHDMRNVVDTVERGGFRAALEIEGPVATIPASLRQALRRTVRELGTNILKHGKPDTDVQIQLLIDQDQVTLRSTNEISSERPISSSRTGLEAMRARCEVFGGEVVTGSKRGVWTTTMTIPFDRQPVSETSQGASHDSTAARR